MNAMRSLGASVAILIGFCLAWGSPSYGRGLNPSAATKIDDAAQRFISGGYGPGVSVAVMQADEVIFARGYGMANLETETPGSGSGGHKGVGRWLPQSARRAA